MEIMKAELTKLMHRKSTKVFMILMGVVFGLMTLIYILGERSFDISLYNQSQFVDSSLKTMMGFILPLFALYIASESFVYDFNKGGIKNMLLLPIRRSHLYIGKVLAILVVIGAALTTQFFLSLSISLIIEGFEVAGLLGIVANYIGAFFALTLVAFFGILLAMTFGNTGLNVFIAYVGYFGLALLNFYIPRFAHISIPSLVGNYRQLISTDAILLLLSLVSYTIILFIASLLLFEKKEDGICQSD